MVYAYGLVKKACARACVRACGYVCVCERESEGDYVPVVCYYFHHAIEAGRQIVGMSSCLIGPVQYHRDR